MSNDFIYAKPNQTKYKITRMRTGGQGDSIIFPETHAHAVHQTNNRMFINASEKATLQALEGSPLIDYNQDTMKNNFQNLMELADNVTQISSFFASGIDSSTIRGIQGTLDVLSPLVNQDTITEIMALINNPKRLLPVVLGSDGSLYNMSVDVTRTEEGETVYTPKFEIQLIDGNVPSPVYTPQNYKAGDKWVVPKGVEPLKLKLPCTQITVVSDNSGIGGQIKLWDEVDGVTSEVLYEEPQHPKLLASTQNSKGYVWLVWRLAFLKEAIKQAFHLPTIEDADRKMLDILYTMENFSWSVKTRPVDNELTSSIDVDKESIVTTVPYMNTGYSNFVRRNGNNMELAVQMFMPANFNQNQGEITEEFVNNFINGALEVCTLCLQASEEGSFEFFEPQLTITVKNPFVGKELVAKADSKGYFDLADWEIKE